MDLKTDYSEEISVLINKLINAGVDLSLIHI